MDNACNLNKKIISFEMIEYPHIGIAVGREIMVEIEKWCIVQIFLFISLDNANCNDVVE